MIIMTQATSSTGTSAAHRSFCIGVTDGTFQGGIVGTDEDAVTTTNSRRLSYNNALIRYIEAAGVVTEAVATFDSWITDGIRINWSNAAEGVQIVHVILWAGDDVLVQCGTTIPLAIGSGPKTIDVGFTVQHLMCLSGLDPVDETLRDDYHIQISHTVNNSGTPTTFATYITQRNAFADSTPAMVRDLDLAQGIRADASPFTYFASTELDPTTPFPTNGFSIISGESGTVGPRIIYFAVNYGTKDYKLQEETAPTSTGVKNFTGYGFRPGFALSMITVAAAAWAEDVENDDSVAGTFGLAHWSGSEQWCMNVLSEDAQATTNTAARTKDKPISLNDDADSGPLTEADFDGFTSDGFDLDYTTASSAFRFVVFALEQDLITGTGAGNFPLAAGAGVALLEFVASGTPSFPLATGAGIALLEFVATGAGTFPLTQGAGVAELQFVATGSGLFPLAAGAGTAELAFDTTGAGTFPLAAGAGVALLMFEATGAGLFPLAQGDGLAFIDITAAGAGIFPLAQGAGVALLIFTSVGDGFFPLALGSGTASSGLTLLGCEVDVEGSRKIVSAIQGSYRLVGTLQGSYDLVSDFEGSVC